MQKGLLTPPFSIGYSSAAIRWILFRFGTHTVTLGVFSEYGIMTFSQFIENSMTKNMFLKGRACPDDNLSVSHILMNVWKSLTFGSDLIKCCDFY